VRRTLALIARVNGAILDKVAPVLEALSELQEIRALDAARCLARDAIFFCPFPSSNPETAAARVSKSRTDIREVQDRHPLSAAGTRIHVRRDERRAALLGRGIRF
jgi:hypothetical protein